MELREFWDGQAEAWGRFARTPGHDVYHEAFNFPAFLSLIPPPGQRTLDLGCGEGRVGAELMRRGHTVVGVDASPAMVANEISTAAGARPAPPAAAGSKASIPEMANKIDADSID